MPTILTPQPQLGDDAKVGHGFSDEGGDDESHRGLSKDSITPSLEAALRLKHQVSRTKVQQQTQVARDLADKCDGKCVVHARIFSAETTDQERLARISAAVDKSDSDSDEDDESFTVDDLISPLEVLKASVCHCRELLLRNKGDLSSLWRVLQSSLSESLEILHARIPSFGDEECEAQLCRLRADLLAMSKAVRLEVGQRVEVEYGGSFCSGTVTGVEDALRATDAEIRVRYDSDGVEYVERLGDGAILVASSPPQTTPTATATQTATATATAIGTTGKRTAYDGWGRAAERLEAAAYSPPFHVRDGCAGAGVVGALDELEEAVEALGWALERVAVWPGRRLALSLRQLLGEVRARSVEARGRLTGAWPTALVAQGQAVAVRAGAGRLRASVRRVGKGRHGEGAELLVEAGGGAGRRTVWVLREAWADQIAPDPAGWPGGDGMGDVRRDDPDLTPLGPGRGLL